MSSLLFALLEIISRHLVRLLDFPTFSKTVKFREVPASNLAVTLIGRTYVGTCYLVGKWSTGASSLEARLFNTILSIHSLASTCTKC